jgi:hypothetical protein
MKQFEGTADLLPGDRISLPKAGGFNLLALNSGGRLIGTKRKKR